MAIFTIVLIASVYWYYRVTEPCICVTIERLEVIKSNLSMVIVMMTHHRKLHHLPSELRYAVSEARKEVYQD